MFQTSNNAFMGLELDGEDLD